MTAKCMCSHGGEKVAFAHVVDGIWRDEVVPVLGCVCGIYGYYHRSNIADLTVRGTIRASGKILMGTHGARVAYAEIESLNVASTGVQYPTKVYRSMVKALRRKYPGVPVYTSVLEWVLAFPSEDVSELLQG
jgi:hypothetical protein